MNTIRKYRSDAGFSLVEVALALMIVGVGMMAIFSVLQTGLSASSKAMGYSQEALFAEEVFNGIRAKAQYTPWSQIKSITLDNIVKDMWKPGAKLSITGGSGGSNVYESVFVPVDDHAVRYQLSVLDAANGDPNVKGLRLLVQNGLYGPMKDAAVYYTEIRRPGS